MERIIQVDLYGDSIHVFVCGYAINDSESTMPTAYKLARSLGAKNIYVSDYTGNCPKSFCLPVNAEN